MLLVQHAQLVPIARPPQLQIFYVLPTSTLEQVKLPVQTALLATVVILHPLPHVLQGHTALL